jgi:hypothetical protein
MGRRSPSSRFWAEQPEQRPGRRAPPLRSALCGGASAGAARFLSTPDRGLSRRSQRRRCGRPGPAVSAPSHADSPHCPERGAARPAFGDRQDPDHRQPRHLLSCERGTQMARWRRYLLAGMSRPLDPPLVAAAPLEAAVRGAGFVLASRQRGGHRSAYFHIATVASCRGGIGLLTGALWCRRGIERD